MSSIIFLATSYLSTGPSINTLRTSVLGISLIAIYKVIINYLLEYCSRYPCEVFLLYLHSFRWSNRHNHSALGEFSQFFQVGRKESSNGLLFFHKEHLLLILIWVLVRLLTALPLFYFLFLHLRLTLFLSITELWWLTLLNLLLLVRVVHRRHLLEGCSDLSVCLYIY